MFRAKKRIIIPTITVITVKSLWIDEEFKTFMVDEAKATANKLHIRLANVLPIEKSCD